MSLKRSLLSSCSVVVFSFTLFGATTDARSQAPTNDQLYRMILELQESQGRLTRQLEAAQAENARARQELAVLRSEASGTNVLAALPSSDGLVGIPSPTATGAVSAPNVRLGFGGGSNSGDAYAFTDGSVALPLGERYGFQIDTLGGIREHGNLAGGAAHLFRRNPEKGAIGLYGSYLYGSGGYTDGAFVHDGYSEGKAGVEGQYYVGRLTLDALAGVEWNSLEDSFSPFAEGRAAYYATDDFKLSAGLRYRDAFDTSLQAVGGLEYLTDFGTGIAMSL